jgi:hypothetical protein
VGLQYKIVYKKGIDNKVADALSRRHGSVDGNDDDLLHCFAISSCQPKWLTDTKGSYDKDPSILEMIQKLTIDPSAIPHFTLVDGVLRYKFRVWIGNDEELKMKLLEACHASTLGGHSGILVTYRRMKSVFAWKGMKKSVHAFVSSCMICQQAKPDRAKCPGLLQPLAIPDGA